MTNDNPTPANPESRAPRRKSLKAWLAERILTAFDACVYCGIEHREFYHDAHKRAVLEVEHIVPVHHGGTNELSNLTVACRRCNRSKGTKSLLEFGFDRVLTAADVLQEAE